MKRYAGLFVLLLAIAAVFAACAPTRTIVHPKVELSTNLPALEGFTYDENYAARSEPEMPFFDYAYRTPKAMTLHQGETLIRRELAAAGWTYVSQDISQWDSKQTWTSTWQRKIAEDRWDRLEVDFIVHKPGRDPKKHFSQVVYRMNND